MTVWISCCNGRPESYKYWANSVKTSLASSCVDAMSSFTTMTLKLVERIFDAYAEDQLEKMVGSLPLAELGDVTKTAAAAAGTPKTRPKTEVV